MTIREWLTGIANTNESKDTDDTQMESLLRRGGFPQAKVTCGIVYMTGYGNPVDIHTTAKAILGASK